MKKLTLLLSLVLAALQPLLAERVTPETAKQVASNFLKINEKNAASLNDITQAVALDNLYVFNTSEGYVVMAADNRVQPILGYSLNGSLNPSRMPENMRAWLQGYNDEIQFAIDHEAKATNEIQQQWEDLKKGTKGVKATVIVEPLLHSLWDQGEPYNNLCPTVSGEATYSGCVATAMAQIMKYWNWPIKGNSNHSYRWNNQTLSANFSNTTYDWANMTDTYDSNSTDAENAAVATLMYHCGVAVEMSYGTDGSGAYSYNIPNALTSYFRYASSASYKSKGFGTSNSTWISQLKTELDAGRPVQYSGSGDGGGHAFVCDGYDNDNYFHFNWGWSGMYDGYFTVNNLNPGTGGAGAGSSGTYNSSQGVVIGIQPSYNSLSAPAINATLQQDLQTRSVTATWNSVSGTSKYQLFRNANLIYEGTNTSFTEAEAPYGTNLYYVRCVDSNNGISQNSNKAVITISFPAPENLTASMEEDLFTVSWDASDLAVAYNLYCNNELIASDLTETSITFTLKAYGDLSFHVRGVDFAGELSDASNKAILSQPFHGPMVNDLTATLDGNNVALAWTAQETETSYFYTIAGYDGYIYGITNTANKAYWAMRIPASTLSFYAGMAMLNAETYVYEAGTYQVSIYQGTGDTPSGTALATASGSFEAQSGWQALTFSSPVPVDYTKDLWIVFSASGLNYILYASMEYEGANYYSTNGSTWNQAPGSTWFIYADLTDGEHTYNLYRNGNRIAQGLTSPSYTDTGLGNNAAYRYTVRTTYYGGESDDSNFYEFVKGEASTNESITMGRNDHLFVTDNSHFTVNGNITNNRPANLVIQPGAQLSTNNAYAGTMQKDIQPYSQSKVNDGWYLLSSPIDGDTPVSEINNLIPENADDYDLYWFDQVGDSEQKEWMNYKVEGQQPAWKTGEGRLYANRLGATIDFSGTLNRQPENGIPVTYEAGYALSGFNLIGNPFTSEAYLPYDYYRMNEEGTELIIGEGAVKPCEGVFVKVNETGTATFTKTPTRKSGIDLSVSKASNTRGETLVCDRAIIRFNESQVMPKLMLNGNNTKLYFAQADKDYAVVQHQGETALPLNFHAGENGTYTLGINTETMEKDYLHLIDHLTGADIDLLQTPNYTFEARTSDYESRFLLVFNTDSNSDHFATFNGSEWIVNNEGEAILQVIDLTGRVLSSRTINGESRITIKEANGIYVLRLLDNDQVRTQKIVKE